MTFHELPIKGLILIEPHAFEDERGFFLERYNQQVFQRHGIDTDFVQDNHSQSAQHVLRGLHFQLPPFAQDKLVWVVRGEVFDVAVDLRRDSLTFGRWHGVTLSEDNKRMFLIPKGFAHGFVTLSEQADFCYKTSQFYSRDHDRGLLWNDPSVSVDWPVGDPILSRKDETLPTLQELLNEKVI